MNPFKLTPHYTDYLWGGERLRTQYGKKTDMTPLAESWELSCHPAGPSVVATGAHAGMTLPVLIEQSDRLAVLGTDCQWYEDFPLLIKLIDAKQALSIQVHPDDDYAREKENSYGKTEMWYVLDCKPDSFVYYGVNKTTTRVELRAAIESNTLESLLDRRRVKPGDVIFIPAGTLHAIGAGILVCEVQQNSNLTYRVYDFGRRGTDGKLRELHIRQALDVAVLTPTKRDFSPAGTSDVREGLSSTLLADCDYFQTSLAEISGVMTHRTEGSAFFAWTCIEGAGALCWGKETTPFEKGESLFIPADAGRYSITGNCQCIFTAAKSGPLPHKLTDHNGNLFTVTETNDGAVGVIPSSRPTNGQNK